MSGRGLNHYSAPGRLLRALLAKRRTSLVTVDHNCDFESLRETRDLVPLLMQDSSAMLIQSCVRAARSLDGEMAEAGVLMGGSARLICKAKGEVPLHLFDVFDSLQGDAGWASAGNEDDVRAHFGNVHGRLDHVQQLLLPYANVRFHCGVFPRSTLGLESTRFSFVHLDLDLVQSTRDALAFFHPRLVPGGILIGDDYADPGVRGAFDDFFAPLGDTVIGLPWSQVLVVKQAN